MRLLRRTTLLVPVFISIAIAGIVLMRPLAVRGAPLLQATPTAPPRPTIAPTNTPSGPGPTPTNTSGPAPTPTNTPTTGPGPGPTNTPSSDAGASTTQGSVSGELALALVVDKAEAQPGDVLHYKAQIANNAGIEAWGVWLTSDLPRGVEVEEVSVTQGEIHQYGRRVSVEVGRMSSSFDSQFVDIRARIREDVEPGTELVHHANLTSAQAGGEERSVTTVVLGAERKTTKVSLPTTGGGALSLWLVVGSAVLILVVALFSLRERIHLPRQ